MIKMSKKVPKRNKMNCKNDDNWPHCNSGYLKSGQVTGILPQWFPLIGPSYWHFATVVTLTRVKLLTFCLTGRKLPQNELSRNVFCRCQSYCRRYFLHPSFISRKGQKSKKKSFKLKMRFLTSESISF